MPTSGLRFVTGALSVPMWAIPPPMTDNLPITSKEIMVDTAGAVALQPEPIAVDSTGQATVRDPEPSRLEATQAAIAEGVAWLEEFGGDGELTEEGALRAEVLSVLISSADVYGGVAHSALGALTSLGVSAEQTLQQIA